MTMPLSLYCYVHGDDPDCVFKATIDKASSVSDLKHAIKEKKKPAFDHIAADSLHLWQVSIPDSERLKEDVKEHLSKAKNPLHGTRILSDLFMSEPEAGTTPTNGHVQVIVKPPEDVTTPVSKRQQRPEGIPSTLLDPVFGTFFDDCKVQPLVAADYATARELHEDMCLFHPHATSRLRNFCDILEKYGIDLNSGHLDTGCCKSHFHIAYEGRPVLILEGTNEIGEGSPELEGLLYYNTLCGVPNLWVDVSSYHPCFIITIQGPYLTFGGFALTDRSAMETFSAFALAFHSSDQGTFTALARHLSALKKAVNTLVTRYTNDAEARSLAPPGTRPSRSLTSASSLFPPYPRTFHPLQNLLSNVAFSYDQQMEGEKLLFSGRRDGDQAPIFIKFVPGYGGNVHTRCADLGFAPKLIAFDKLPGGWYMVVMEQLDKSWVYLDDESCQREGLRASIHDAVTRLHQEGMVHGDICRTNILVKKDGGRDFMLLGFDWAGRDGEVNYPLIMEKDPKLGRPAGVRGGAPILSAHDNIMFERLFA